MTEQLSSLMAAMDILPDGVLIVDQQQHIIGCNQALERLFGYEPGDLLGRPLGILLPASVRPAHVRNVTGYDPVDSGQPMEKRPILAGISKSGERLPLSIGISTIGTPDERYFVAVVRDAHLLDDSLEKAISRADTDPLTQLGNRRYLESRLGEFEQNDAERNIALLFLDLDDFKPLNDEYGHEVGDEVLTIVGRRIRGSLRDGDTCVRLGGDEFVVLLPSVTDPGALESVALKLHRSLTAPMHVRQMTMRVGVSIGGTIGSPRRAGAAAVLDHADAAMYRAKLKGAAYCFHDSCRPVAA